MERPDFFKLKNGEKVKLPFSNKEYNNRVSSLRTVMDKKNLDMIKSIEDQIDTLSKQGYSFKEIVKILSKNEFLKVSAGRSGWQNKDNFKLNIFEKLFQFPEGKIIKERKIKYLIFFIFFSKKYSYKKKCCPT